MSKPYKPWANDIIPGQQWHLLPLFLGLFTLELLLLFLLLHLLEDLLLLLALLAVALLPLLPEIDLLLHLRLVQPVHDGVLAGRQSDLAHLPLLMEADLKTNRIVEDSEKNPYCLGPLTCPTSMEFVLCRFSQSV